MIHEHSHMHTISDVIRAHASADDGREFLRLQFSDRDDQVLSYADLVDEARRWTEFYRVRGVQPGQRVIVILPHSVDVYAAYIGAILGGHIPAMFNFPSPKFSEELYFSTVGQLIERSHAHMLITYEELRDKLKLRAAGSVKAIGIAVPSEVGEAGDQPNLTTGLDDVAFLQYSSGTTGIKKGVALSHRALLWQVGAYGQSIGANADDRIVSWLPLYHDMGLICAFFLPLIRKIPLVSLSPFDWVKRPALWMKAVSQHGGTLSWMPNFAYNFMARSVPADDLTNVDLSSLRGLVNCSEPVLAHSHDLFLERFAPYGFPAEALACCYAMAENTFAVTSAGFGQSPKIQYVDISLFEKFGQIKPLTFGSDGGRALVSSGQPLADTDLRVVGTEGETLPECQVGEIVISSPCLMTEYDANPEATAEAMVDDWFFTGDLGYVSDGEVYVTGRKKELIIIGGRNIYPQDIETAVSQLTEVISGRCVAFGIPDEVSGTERLIILAESEAPAADHERICAAIYSAVAERTEVVPGDIRILPPRWLVKSSSGKNARGANRARYVEEYSQKAASPPPKAALEPQSLLDLVRSIVLGRLRQIPGVDILEINDSTPLLTSGLIDSFGLADLIVALEVGTGCSLSSALLRDVGNINTISAIATGMGNATLSGGPEAIAVSDVPMAYGNPIAPRRSFGFWTLFYRVYFRLRGIACGPGLQVMGPLLLQIDGRPENISLGANVTLMPGVHLKNRENGKIIMHDGVKLDTMVRLVAANEATIELGENVAFGMGTVINAGADVRVGRGAMSSVSVMINASDHGMAAGTPMRRQGYEHAPILIGEDVFLGAHSYIGKGCRVGNGAAISSGAAITSVIPEGAIVQGRPGRVVKFRY